MVIDSVSSLCLCPWHIYQPCGCLVAAYQNAIREQKLAAEISAAKRERDFYMGQVDKAKGIEAMKERKRKVSLAAGPQNFCNRKVQFWVSHVEVY